MNKREPMKINISQSFYNNLTSKDGIHYNEVSEDRPYYNVRAEKNYFDIRSEIELKKQMLEDFREIVEALEKDLEKDLEQEQER